MCLLVVSLGVYAQTNCASYIFADDSHLPPPPVYTTDQQKIFWVSPSQGAGHKVLVKGAFGPGPFSVSVSSVPGGTPVVVPATQVTSEGLQFVLPPGGPVYAFRILNTNLQGSINAPLVYWAMGVGNGPLEPAVFTPGDSLRILGLNFPSSGNVLLKSNSGQTISFTYTTDMAEQISMAVPLSLPAGAYTLYVTGGPAYGDLASNGISLQVASAPAAVVVRKVACPGFEAGTLNRFLKTNAPKSGNLIVEIPAGNFVLTGPIVLQPHEYLEGAGATATFLTALGAPPPIWIQGTHDFGVSDLSFSAPVQTALIGNFINMYDFSQDLASLGHVSLDHLSLTASGTQLPNGQPAPVMVGGPDIRISYVETNTVQVNAYNAIGLYLIPTSGAWIAHNHNELGQTGVGMYIYSYQGVLVEYNEIEGMNDGAAAGISVPTARITGSARNMMMAHNDVRYILSQNREAITTDIGGGAFFGYATSVSGAEMTLSATPNWLGTNPNCYRITITAGPGLGQYRNVVSASGSNLTVDHPWDVNPTPESLVSICLYQEHLQIVDNTFERAGEVQFYGSIFNSQIIGNQMHDAMGINLYSGIYFCGMQPLEDNVISGNVVSGNPVGDTVRNFGISMSARDVTAISGLLITGNTVPSNGQVLITDAVSSMHPLLLETAQVPVVLLPRTSPNIH